MRKLSHIDGSWSELLTEWSDQCHQYGEEFANYLPETMALLGNLVEDTGSDKWDGVFSYVSDGRTEAVAFLNCAFLPGFSGRVLRVRHIILAPRHDFGEYESGHYAQILGTLFERIIEISGTLLPCSHVKLHFRSPADLDLFKSFSKHLAGSDHFASVQFKGAWLLLTKK